MNPIARPPRALYVTFAITAAVAVLLAGLLALPRQGTRPVRSTTIDLDEPPMRPGS